MILLVGLGNPGKKYIHTRHNLGFRVLDSFAEENNFPVFKLVKKFQAEISEGVIEDKKVILVKPQTFMNNSGQAVKFLIAHKFIKFTKGKNSKNLLLGSSRFLEFLRCLFVVHDDIDLPLGKIKIVKNRGSAGHKGVESIIKELGTRDFVRVRIGIQPSTGKPEELDKFVLQKFNKEEEKIIKEVIKNLKDLLITRRLRHLGNFGRRTEDAPCPLKTFQVRKSRTNYLTINFGN